VSDKAISGIALAGLLACHQNIERLILSTAWYDKKSDATFSGIIAFVRGSIWAGNYFNDCMFEGEYMKIRQDQWEMLLDQLSRTA
jgi:hypothetical protein